MREEDRGRDLPSGREMMRIERERLRQRAAYLPLRSGAPEAPAIPSGPLPRFEMPREGAPVRPAGTGANVLKVACPACKAAVGMACFIPASPDKRPNGGTHPSRRDLSAGISFE